MADPVPCPKCGSSDVKKVRYAWWGGAIGPRLFNHTKCNNCGTTYNGKTGKSNMNLIIIYNAVLVTVCLSGLCLILVLSYFVNNG